MAYLYKQKGLCVDTHRLSLNNMKNNNQYIKR